MEFCGVLYNRGVGDKTGREMIAMSRMAALDTNSYRNVYRVAP